MPADKQNILQRGEIQLLNKNSSDYKLFGLNTSNAIYLSNTNII
jgi:hypothetical protein